MIKYFVDNWATHYGIVLDKILESINTFSKAIWKFKKQQFTAECAKTVPLKESERILLIKKFRLKSETKRLLYFIRRSRYIVLQRASSNV